MKMQRVLFIISFCLVSLFVCSSDTHIELSEEATISLLTCSPGTEVYSKYGHSALRVVDRPNRLDITFNYGVFQFDSDDFYLKFIKGETYYQLDVENTNWFIYSSELIGRTTYEQILNLTYTQKQQLLDSLLVNYEPQNRYYLYNFVFDNCATRPYRLLKSIVPEFSQLVENTDIAVWSKVDSVTFRQLIRYYSPPNSWVGAGIDFVFGADADKQVSSEQRLFLPEQLMLLVKSAKFADGTAICTSDNTQPFVIEQPPLWFSPYMLVALIILTLLICTWIDLKHTKYLWIPDVILWFGGGLLGTIGCYLSLFSIHPLVGHNWNLLVYNPAAFLFVLIVLIPRCRYWFERHLTQIGVLFTLYASVRIVLITCQSWHWLMLVPIAHGIRLIVLGINYKRKQVDSSEYSVNAKKPRENEE